MKNLFLLIICLMCMVSASAQLDTNSETVEFEFIDTQTETPTGYELPALKIPSLREPKDPIQAAIDSDLGLNKPKKFDMTKGDGLLDYTTDKAPRAFTKDKTNITPFGEDQALGEVRTRASKVNVVYRDHEFVDGDRIRVYVNKDVVRSDIALTGSFNGLDIPLQQGINEVDFLALNQGSSGPNTAELHIYDDNGQLVSAKKWNLLTGYKATIIIIKE